MEINYRDSLNLYRGFLYLERDRDFPDALWDYCPFGEVTYAQKYGLVISIGDFIIRQMEDGDLLLLLAKDGYDRTGQGLMLGEKNKQKLSKMLHRFYNANFNG